MKRRTFVGALLAMISAPVAWAFPKKKEPKLAEFAGSFDGPFWDDVFEQIDNRQWIKPGYYTITSVKNGPSEYEGYGPYVGDKIKIG